MLDQRGQAAVDNYLTWLALKGHKHTTIRDRRWLLGRLARDLGPVPLLEATHTDLSAWRAGLAVSDSVIGNYVTNAHDFYRWTAQHGLTVADPTEGVPVPRRKRSIPRPIGEENLYYALATAPPRVRPWLVLAGWAGLRAVEIALLQRHNVLDTHTPPVIVVAEDATKGSRPRTVEMCAFVLYELRMAGMPRAGYMFRRLDGRPGPNTPGRISQLCNRHLRECGMQETAHQLRHRFATRIYQSTKDIRMLQELLGHASPQTSAIYAQFFREDAAAAVESLPVPKRLRDVTRSDA